MLQRVQIEEFQGIHPDVVRSVVAQTAYAANSLALAGVKVCGISIRVENDMLIGSTRVLVPTDS